MTRSVTAATVPADGPGTMRHLIVHRYGHPAARPKAFVQAALHADEVPGMLVAHHLIRLLDDAADRGAVRGEIIVLPAANPLGLDQVVQGRRIGRFALAGGGNFNRGFPDLADAAARAVRGRLGDDAAANVALIRAALVEALAARQPLRTIDHVRHALLRLAIDADVVLDLHCDGEALMHLYLGTPLWPQAEDLARQLGCRAVLLAETSGDVPFDEACSTPWWMLPKHLAGRWPIPAACLAATVELRGARDVSDELAATDAENLLRFLARRGLLDSDPGPLPEPLAEASPLAGVDMVTAGTSGILVLRTDLGETVAAGQLVAEVVDPTTQERTALRAATEGLVFARDDGRAVRPGDVVVKIAGAQPLPGKGPMLLTDR